MTRPSRLASPSGDPGYPALKARLIARTGHHYYADKDDLLFDRLRRRFKAKGLSNATDYLALLAGAEDGPAEWAALEAEITIGETFFFRYAEQFAALRQTILPGLIAARAAERSLTIWSAGCSTGAEPYSLAILVSELLGKALPQWRVAITGTDISVEALAAARAAAFGRWALRTLPIEDRIRYFAPGPPGSGSGATREGSFALRPEFRRMVRFERHNLMSLLDGAAPPSFEDVDLILCRNVLIYFEAQAVLGIVRGLGRRLAPDGWLLIGHAEPNPAFSDWLDPVNLPGTVAYRRRAAGPPGLDAPQWSPIAAPGEPSDRSERSDPERRLRLPDGEGQGQAEDLFGAPAPPAPARPAQEGEPRAAPESPVGAPPLARIRALADSGDTAAAWRLSRAAIDQAPTDAPLRYYDGLLALDLGREAEAERAFRGAIYLDRAFVMAHYQLGLLLIALGDGVAAGRALDNAIRLCEAMPMETQVPESDGVTAARIAESARLARAGLSRAAP